MNNIYLPKKVVFQLVIALFVATNICLLLINVQTLNIWGDDISTIYLSQEPFRDLITRMANNIHEEPPLFNILLHFWIKFFGTSSFSLRILPICLWLGTLPAAYLISYRLTKSQESSLLSIAFLCLMPYHWVYPIAVKWYSLAGCLILWNLYSLVRLVKQDEIRLHEKTSFPYFSFDDINNDSTVNHHKNNIRFISSLYIITGVLLWYTNYSAPIYFFAGGVAVILWSPNKKEFLILLGILWFIIFVLYIPWIPTFIRQLKISIGVPLFANHLPGVNFPSLYMSLANILTAGYVMFLGNSVLPWHWHIIVPMFIGLFLLLYLVFISRKYNAIPLLTFLIVAVALIITGTIFKRRLLLLTPILGVVGGISFYYGWYNRKRIMIACAVLLGVAWLGSASNMVRQTGWLFQSWIDDYRGICEEVKGEFPQAFIITNNGCVFYHLDSSKGETQQKREWRRMKPEKTQTIIEDYPCLHYSLLRSGEEKLAIIWQLIKNNRNIVYIHSYQADVFPLGPVETLSWVEHTLIDNGYRVAERRYKRPDQAIELKRYIYPNLPNYRIVVLIFEKAV